jgi:hypothetical protein
MAAWIGIRFLNVNPDPGGLKRAKKEGKNASIRQVGTVIWHIKDKKQCDWYKMGKCFLFLPV